MLAERVIRVAVADDHPIARQGIAALIDSADDMTVVAQVPDGESALALTDGADILLIDVRLPGMDGLETTRQLREADADIDVVIITAMDDAGCAAEAVQAGAKAYLLKTAEGDEILETVRMVAHGHVVFAEDTWQALTARQEPSDIDDVHLSPRANGVLVLLSKGLSNRQIAEEFGISIETVKTHVERLYKRLGVATRTDAVAKALRAGLID